MLIQSKISNLNNFKLDNREIDWIKLEWFETSKRVLRKKTVSGQDVSLKFLNENPALTQGDILFADDRLIVAVDIIETDCLVIRPYSMFEMASVCYEIGNKHLPLFFDNDQLLVPFEQPLFRLLQAQGYEVKREHRKLLNALKTTVSPHPHANESLFSRIMKLTNAND